MCGAAAFKIRLERVQKLADGSFAKFTMAELDKVGIFGWMLTDVECTSFGAICHKFLDNLGIACMQVVAAGASAGSSDQMASFTTASKNERPSLSTKKGKKKKAASDDGAEFNRLFD